MTPEELVGRRIAEIRERFDMTQQQLGEHLGELLGRPWPRQTVSAAEKGRRGFTATELFAVAHVLDTWPGRLFAPPADLEQLDLPAVTIERDDLIDPTRRQANAVLTTAAQSIGEVAALLGDQITERHTADRETLRKVTDLYEALSEIALPVRDDAVDDVPAGAP